MDGVGNLYVTDQGNRSIRKVVLSTGAVTTLEGSAGIAGSSDGVGAAARFTLLSGMALDGAGHVYVADEATHQIRRVVLDTGAVTTVAGAAMMSGSTDGVGLAARFNVPRGLAISGATCTSPIGAIA